MSDQWDLPSANNFEPGVDNLRDPDKARAYKIYSDSVTDLINRTAATAPVYKTLYDQVPDFNTLTGILSHAATFAEKKQKKRKLPPEEIKLTGLPRDAVESAKMALDSIDKAEKDQGKNTRLRRTNMFYGRVSDEKDEKGGLGWHTEYGTEDGEYSDPVSVDMVLDENPKKANKQLTNSIEASLSTAAEKWGARGHGGNQSGKFEEGTLLRGAKSYADHPGTLIILHISRALYNYMNGEGSRPTEVQTLCVADRIVVSANESIAQAFMGSFATAKAATLKGVIEKVVGNPDQYDYKAPSRSGELGKFLEHSHGKTVEALRGVLDPEAAAIVIAGEHAKDEKAFYNTVFNLIRKGPTWKAGSYKEAAAWLRDAESENGVFWMDPPDLGACHAEGGLVALLAESGLKAPAIIGGTMRPCTGCFLTLRFARERLGLDLRGATTHNGGFWATTQSGGMLALISAFASGQLQNLDEYQNADSAGRKEIEDAFKLEGVAAFSDFVRRNFPDTSNASNLESRQTQKQTKLIPNTALRRMPTPPEDHFTSYHEENAMNVDKPQSEATGGKGKKG